MSQIDVSELTREIYIHNQQKTHSQLTPRGDTIISPVSVDKACPDGKRPKHSLRIRQLLSPKLF